MARRNSNRHSELEYQRRQQRRLKAISGGVVTSSDAGRIVAAYVPNPIVWSATGLGTVGIVREQSNGSCRYGFAILDLQRSGLYMPGGKADLKAGAGISELEEFLASKEIPASEPGDPELAGRLLFGAYAYSLEQDIGWPDDIFKYLSLFPKPPGTAGDWLRWFKSPAGMISERLWPVMQGCSDLTEEIPEGKDPVVYTEVLLSVPDTRRLSALLDTLGPEFSCESTDSGIARYSVSRAYPKGHWNPLSRLPGARQNIGEVELDNRTVSVQASTLAFTARILTRIYQVYGPGIEMRETEYDDPNRERKGLRGMT